MTEQPATRLRKLAFSAPFQALVERGQSFDLMQALGVTSRELVYSNAVAFLFDPMAAHCFGARPLVRFLRAVEAASEEEVLPFASLLGGDLGRVRVLREHRGIDVLIELTDRRAVVAIENKVFAGEQEEQVARYQAQLARDYPGGTWHSCLVFLSPHGVAPQTGSADSHVSVVPVSYRLIADLLADAGTLDSAAESARFAQALAQHIRHEILGDHPMEEKIWALWSDPSHAQALSDAVRHCPDLTSVKDDFLERVRSWSEGSCNLTLCDVALYPTKGTPSELAFTFQEWKQLGLPVLIKFYWFANPAKWEAEGHQAAIRAFIWCEDFEKHKADFEALKQRVPQGVSQDFAPIKQWGRNWHRFFPETDYPPDAVVPFRNEGFVDALVVQAQTVISAVDDIIRGSQ